MTKIPQLLMNVKVKSRPPLNKKPNIVKAIQQQKKRLGEHGRILVRYSGTEPLLRIMVETEDIALMYEVAQILQETALSELSQF